MVESIDAAQYWKWTREAKGESNEEFPRARTSGSIASKTNQGISIARTEQYPAWRDS